MSDIRKGMVVAMSDDEGDVDVMYAVEAVSDDGWATMRRTYGDGWAFGQAEVELTDRLTRVHHHEGRRCVADDEASGDGWLDYV